MLKRMLQQYFIKAELYKQRKPINLLNFNIYFIPLILQTYRNKKYNMSAGVKISAL